MSYVKCALGVVGALGLAALSQQAQATTLADLMSAGTPVVRGNVVYSNFTDNAGGSSSPGAMLPGSAITVNFSDPAGVSFSGNWNSLAPGANHTAIGYTITTTNGTTITGGGLFFGGQVVVGSGAAAFVGETLTDVTNNKNYNMQVYYDGAGGQADNLRDSITINPATTQLNIIKSIDVTGGANGGFAALNFVENTFTTAGGGGAPPGVPEPMTLALLPLALAGLGLRKKLAR